MLGITDFGAFCAAILVFLALPGPGTFALLTSTGKGGFRAGAAATAGRIAAHPTAFRAVQVAGAAYLAWIGLRLLLARGDGAASPVPTEPRHYARQVHAHRRLAAALQRLASVVPIGFGWRPLSD